MSDLCIHFATYLPWEVFPIAFDQWFIKCFKPALWRMCLLWFNLLRQMSLGSSTKTILFISVFCQFERSMLAFCDCTLHHSLNMLSFFCHNTGHYSLSLDSLPMDDICTQWRQTALIQLPVAAETLSTVVDKCYTKALSHRVHFLCEQSNQTSQTFSEPIDISSETAWLGSVIFLVRVRERVIFLLYAMLFISGSDLWKWRT